MAINAYIRAIQLRMQKSVFSNAKRAQLKVKVLKLEVSLFQTMSMEGHPVTIITLDEDEKLNLDEAALKSVLNQPELKDRPVCLLPIAGTSSPVTICLYHFAPQVLFGRASLFF